VYVYLNGQPLAKIEETSVYYYHNDALGTPQKMTDSTGTVVWAADYKPFGEVTITVSTITNNLRFPGQYYDAETGLHYNLNRDYSPPRGGYIEADPIGIIGGGNHLYQYVQNNPIKLQDPTGLKVEYCVRALHGMSGRVGNFYHGFLKINGTTYGFAPKNGNERFSGPGRVWPNEDWDVNNNQHDGSCSEEKCIDEAKLQSNIQADMGIEMHYNLLGNNCRQWALGQLSRARKSNCCSQ